jgi:imidazolonepropionase-like amidohydrolase
MTKLLTNAVIFDGHAEALIEGGSVLVEGDTIVEMSERTLRAPNAEVIDCAGRFLMPGLIDAHFHAYSASFDIPRLDRMPVPLLVSHAAKHLQDALQRGFTTVRDPGGGDVGLHLAIERGLIQGPRFLYGGSALSQTGGHGDMRHAFEQEPCSCSYSGVICRVVDGVDDVRRVVRDELRKGADHIKVFISGGVTSPTDPIWMPQFTDAEIRAAVEEAAGRRKYVAAHCHTDDGARRCVANGVRSIEHATQIGDATAKLIAASGCTYVVPTLAVLHQLRQFGPATGLSAESRAKAAGILEQTLESIRTCRRAGVKIGLGTDVFGTEFHDMQAQEFRYRAEVDQPIDILRSATSVNAEIVQRGDTLGQIAPGAKADLIVLDRSPLEDVTIFERYRTEMPVVMRGGQLVRNTLR